MRLLSAHIENFGTLKNTDYAFSEGLNCICKKNGSGKTTFAAFLCAMLYGMDTTKENDRQLKERAHYAPWNAGKFGGSVELEKNGEIYRIERIFDPKSAAKDLLQCYLLTNGVKKTELLPTPGEYLLGIPKSAFMRTVFFSGRDNGSMEGLLPRLNQCINGSVDTDLYSNASALLTASKKKYKPERGSGGRLEQLQNQRKSAERELKLCLASKEAAEADEKEKEKAEKELAEIRRRLELANAYAQALLHRSAYEEFCQQAKQAEKALSLFEEQYGPRPAEELLETCRKLLDKIRTLRLETEAEPFSEREKSEFLRLQNCFDQYPVDQEKLDCMEHKLQEMQNAGVNYRQANALLESEETKVLLKQFNSFCPTEEDLHQLEQLCTDYEEAKKAYDRYNEDLLFRIKNQKIRDKKWTPYSLGLSIGGGVLTLSGIVFTILQLPLSVPLLILGILGIASGILWQQFSDRLSEKESTPKPEPELEERYRSLHRTLSDRLNLYGYFGSDFSLLLKNLKDDRKRYLQKKEACEEAAFTAAESQKCLNRLNGELSSFLGHYPPKGGGDMALQLRFLREDLQQYLSLSEKLKKADEQRTEKEALLSAAEDQFSTLLSPYTGKISLGQEESSLEEQQQWNRQAERLSVDAHLKRNTAENYKRTHPFPSLLPTDLPSEEEKEQLQREATALSSAIASLEKRLDEENRNAERENECRALLENLTAEYAKAQEEFRILGLAITFLKSAEENLLGRYTAPLCAAYKSYAEEISSELSEGLYIEPSNLSLSFKREGELRQEAYFSSGFIALSDICLRLATAKIAFGKEHPFLLLDDPFVYLDDENLKKALKALKKLEQQTQILYFTCHSDRKTEKEPLAPEDLFTPSEICGTAASEAASDTHTVLSTGQ